MKFAPRLPAVVLDLCFYDAPHTRPMLSDVPITFLLFILSLISEYTLHSFLCTSHKFSSQNWNSILKTFIGAKLSIEPVYEVLFSENRCKIAFSNTKRCCISVGTPIPYFTILHHRVTLQYATILLWIKRWIYKRLTEVEWVLSE